MKIKNEGGLLVDEDTNTALGYIFNAAGRSFEPNGAKLDSITADVADAHNAILSKAEVDAVRKMEVGQVIALYFTHETVKTWTGEKIANGVIDGKTVRFWLDNNREFRGRESEYGDVINFRRVK